MALPIAIKKNSMDTLHDRFFQIFGMVGFLSFIPSFELVLRITFVSLGIVSVSLDLYNKTKQKK